VPHRYNSTSIEGRPPPQVRFRLARGSVAPSGGIPPRSGAGRPLERGSVSIESRAPPRASLRLARGHHGPAASIPAPPVGAFNALTFAGAQVKDESTPLHAWESRPGTAPPTPMARPSPPLCLVPRRGRAQRMEMLPALRKSSPSSKLLQAQDFTIWWTNTCPWHGFATILQLHSSTMLGACHPQLHGAIYICSQGLGQLVK
jgi:hypothetical protein